MINQSVLFANKLGSSHVPKKNYNKNGVPDLP